jgi:hypothetical protein
MDDEFDFDLFISHASEDKAGFVNELVGAVRERGLRPWYDQAELQVGDSLAKSIDDGLRRSRFGVVVLSKAFFAKDWPRAELDALASRELSGDGDVVVLPIWLNVGRDDVAHYSPLLASKLGLPSSEGVETIAAKLEKRVHGSGADLLAAASPVAPAPLEPSFLRGHIFPSSYSRFIENEDHALLSRLAIAARVPTETELILRGATQKLFEDALAGSLLESLLQDLTMRGRRPPSEHFWGLVEPTRTYVITAARPATRIAWIDGYTAEARAAISLKPQPSVGPLGWLILHVDVAIRAPSEATPAGQIPLSLDDLFALVYVPLTAILDEIAPTVLPAITGAEPELLAVGCLVMPHTDQFSRYVGFSHYAGPRVAGASDPYAIDWYPSSLVDVATPEARTIAVRRQIEGLFIDGGYRDYELSIDRLEPPRPGPPVAT